MNEQPRNVEPSLEGDASGAGPSDEYLWDGSGAGDPTMKSLEVALGQFALPADGSSLAARERAVASRRKKARVVGGVLVVAIGAAAAWMWSGNRGGTIGPIPDVVGPGPTLPAPRTVQVALAAKWDVVGETGSAKIGERSIEKLPLAFRGRWVETGEEALSMRSGSGATLDIRPHSRVRVSAPEDGTGTGTDQAGPPAEVLIETGGVTVGTPEASAVLVGAGPQTVVLRPASRLSVTSDEKAGIRLQVETGQADAGGPGERRGGQFGVRLLANMRMRVDGRGDLTVPADDSLTKGGEEFAKAFEPLALAMEGRSKMTPEDALGPVLMASQPENAAVLWNVMSMLEAPSARREVAVRIVKLIDQQLHSGGGPKVAPIEVPESLDAEFADRLWKAIVSLRQAR